MNEFQKGELKRILNDIVDRASEIGLKMTPIGPEVKSIDEATQDLRMLAEDAFNRIIALLEEPPELRGPSPSGTKNLTWG